MDESKCKPSQKAFRKKMVDKNNICGRITSVNAGIAHPVERHLAKVEVASSSLVARSIALLHMQ